MRFSCSLAAVLACAAVASTSQVLRPRNYDTHDYYVVHLDPVVAPSQFASHLALEYDGPLGPLRDHHLFRSVAHPFDLVKEAVELHKGRKRKRDTAYEDAVLDGVLLHQKQQLRAPMQKRLVPPRLAGPQPRQFATLQPANEMAVARSKEIAGQLGIMDPTYTEQWHLFNPVQLGHDLNVTGVWMDGFTGKNVTACIVDDGLDMDSDDLRDNYFAAGSYDFNDQVDDPKPRLADDRHGTRCAGEVSAVRNDVCGIGVAYDSKVAGVRILSKAITDADEALAMVYEYQKNDIYSCSWGPPDDGMEMGAPGILIKRAMVDAVQNGRKGRGTIYVFAAGNGAAADDNCNFDGYTNSIYSITVGAIDREGHHPYYSEKCSAQLVVTYSSGSGDFIHTTDVGASQCVATHGGTSAAGPLAVGVFALALEARPDLSWRDMQYLALQTAVPLDEESDWQTTSIGKKFSHQFGYGKLDAYALVDAAKGFQSVKPQAWYDSPWQHIRHDIPEGDVGLSHTFVVSKAALEEANFKRVEHITVTMNIDHTRRGDLAVELRSPNGISSHLSTARKHDNFPGGYEDWTFMSVAHWGESGDGAWTIVAKDLVANEHNGTLIDWKLTLWGECADAEKQGLLPMPTEHDDDEHDSEVGTPTTTSIEPTGTPDEAENPEDHLDRPVNVKTSYSSSSTAAAATTASSSTAAFEAPVLATPTGAVDADEDDFDNDDEGLDGETQSASDNFLPSPFPTFGVSKRTQVWIYGSAGLIAIFCISLGAYFWVARRRRQRALARENYEFQELNSEDDEAGAGPRRGPRRRAGELYDAFAGESDEELFSGDEHEKYRDGEQEEGAAGSPSEKRGP